MPIASPKEYRERMRLRLIEQLVLQTALISPIESRELTVSQSQQRLERWLESNAARLDEVLGAHFREPSQTALYAEEVREMVDEMKEFVAGMCAAAAGASAKK